MGWWGYGLFESDNDADIVSELGHDLGLTKLEEEMQAAAKAAGKSEEEINSIYLSICGGSSHADVVREHLDSGALTDLIKVMETKMLSFPDGSQDQLLEYMFRDPCYCYVLLGACAMTLGCRLPEPYLDMLRVVFTEGGLLPDALKQMHKALFGPGGYKDGEPYDFESKGLVETANAIGDDSDEEPGGPGWKGMNVMPPGGIFNTGRSTSSITMKELRNKVHNPDVCAECYARHGEGGTALLLCSKCKGRKYCSTGCQREHWKVHKKICRSEKLGLSSP
ncbi:hypothetical protein C7974DRAFT_143159 [Boeremia exigua]|uniref:uncharacterized protein n=1 Tax=Boeremia exigua TaxID=749465 RepID=UPI001E8EE4E2|nr:uncharacterized protein C7974DRAFT_143159 [Boeremia exigua]KAH6637534.1 hypothetical protein C7974DRAFT_143159 [Boeremia exigua]